MGKNIIYLINMVSYNFNFYVVFRSISNEPPLAVGMKAYLVYFLFRREFEVALREKSLFLVQISWILKLWFENWFFNGFLETSSPFV